MNSNKTTSHVADMPAEAFTALAELYIYHFEDLAWKGINKASRRRERLRLLHKHGVISELKDPENGDEIHKRYCQAIEDHVENTFPEDWEPTHDYWGAKCICYKPGWDAPKEDTYFAGDSSFRYMAFADAASLKDYTKRSLAEIQTAIDLLEEENYLEEESYLEEENHLEEATV